MFLKESISTKYKLFVGLETAYNKVCSYFSQYLHGIIFNYGLGTSNCNVGGILYYNGLGTYYSDVGSFSVNVYMV